jgi:hypothetical protein
MVDVDMNPTPPKVIKRKACLRTRSFYGLSKNLKPKGVQTLEGKKKKELHESGRWRCAS